MAVEFDQRLSRTFILGAGFSASQQFPLMRDLRERLVHFLEAERHFSYWQFLRPRSDGLPEGPFYTGLKRADPSDSLQFEELLTKLSNQLKTASSEDPCWITRDVLSMGCARLLWCIHNSIWRVEATYENFANWVGTRPETETNAILSFNWDILAEQALHDADIPWAYSLADSTTVPVLKPHGSVNWNTYLREGLQANYSHWRPISPDSRFSYDSANPFSNPDRQEVHPSLRYMIFPGNPELPEKDEDIGLIWKEAERAIGNRDIVVFLGYSLPSYDSYALKFFKRVCKDKRIEVHDPDPTCLERFRSELGNDVKVFKEKFEHSPYALKCA